MDLFWAPSEPDSRALNGAPATALLKTPLPFFLSLLLFFVLLLLIACLLIPLLPLRLYVLADFLSSTSLSGI